jgi:undecaprenyl-diphosphatase
LLLDREVLLWVQRRERQTVKRVMSAVTHLGDTSTWLLLAAVLAASGGAGPRRAALLVAGAVAALALTQPLKRICARRRPRWAEAGPAGAGQAVRPALAEDPDAFSFPSGHTAVAFAVAVALAGEGTGLGLVALGLAAAIGASRVYLRAHYPLDVAAGALLGSGTGWVARGFVPTSELAAGASTLLGAGLPGVS